MPRVARMPGMHHDGRGLYLKVAGSGSVSWVLRYMLSGKAHTMGLGPYPEVTLKRAREKAFEARALKAEGVDPIAARRAGRAVAAPRPAPVTTFKMSAEAFIESRESGWRHRGKTADQWRAAFRDWVYPIIGDRAVTSIDTAAVLAVLRQPVVVEDRSVRFWEARPETASRCRSRIENVLDFARARGDRTGDNPADWATLRFVLPRRHDVHRVKHHDALPYDQVASFVTGLRASTAASARVLEFTILTAARTTEVRGMTWGEVDLDAGLWTIPAGRMKGKREHRVPLPASAVSLLRDLKGGREGLVFPGARAGRPLSENTMLNLLQVTHADATVHGFRSAFSTWAREQTDFRREIVEASLAHTVGSAVERAYARTDFIDARRKLLEAWAAYCAPEAPPR